MNVDLNADLNVDLNVVLNVDLDVDLNGDEKMLVLIGFEFSDEFEPNTTKSNRQSIWMKSLSISPSPEHMNSMITTPYYLE